MGRIQINKQFKEQLSQQLRSVLVLKPELAEKTAFIITMLIDGTILADHHEKAETQYPPIMAALGAAKAIIRSEGGDLD
ncbi:hypothetical protein [Pseudomonas sp. P9_31]|uniref:hypothetical protein n=1 Tax=Pseudomonas sp. P9_31 TaxID=3043448 RepID=UPI002A3709B0|nr:hypothetical protein [Pseudomonas sp. P9_31]WPN60557.1 hypothetical protein QMK51_13580 [Pseudomonas sp. P9_31]